MESSSRNKVLMSGNEAIARGALEAGICFCASYPGTPSTEIASTLMKASEEQDIYVEWSVNEKVALEACVGASWAGLPSICPMKSLGLNVAADFLLNVNLSGIGPGGVVIVVCDDPRGHSSSNEQDSRFFAKAAYLPLLEPATCQQAKDAIPMALALSRKYQIPVIVRSTTRLSHSRSVIQLGEVDSIGRHLSENFAEAPYNVPNPHLRHRNLVEKLADIAKSFELTGLNGLSNDTGADTLILASGIAFRYAKEAVDLLGASSVQVANLVTTHPIPRETLAEWIRERQKVLFIEEVDPFIEDAVLAMVGELQWSKKPTFSGKRNGTVPSFGELDTNIVMEALRSVLGIPMKDQDEQVRSTIMSAKEMLIPRPLTFCAGCTHRNVYWALGRVRRRIKEGLIVTGDIGCYSLGVFYNESMNTMQAMGSGIGTANGLGQLERFGLKQKVVTVAGDSTFFHACLPGLVNAKHKNANVTFLILDNSTTAMTGFQSHPGSFIQSPGNSPVSIEKIVKAVEPAYFEILDAADIEAMINAIHNAVKMSGLKVLLIKSVCRLEEQGLGETYEGLSRVLVDIESCKGESCRICTSQFACLALGWNEENNKAEVNEDLCVRCGACIPVCPHDAIRREDS